MTKYFGGGGGGGGGGAVASVFGRAGAVVAALNDYAASLVDNDSTVAGSTVKDALETLDAAIPSVPVTSVFSRIGAVVAALNDYASSLIDNDSAVAGATVKDALETLNAASGVTSVFTRVGAVVAVLNDYSTDLIDDATNLFLGATTLSQVITALLGPVSNQAGAAYTLAISNIGLTA